MFAEIDDEADFNIGGLHVGEGLSNVNLGDAADRFQLLMFRAIALTLRVDHHFVRNEEVQAMPAHDEILVSDLYFQFRLCRDASQPQFVEESILVYRFQEARPEGRVDIHSSPDDRVSQAFRFHPSLMAICEPGENSHGFNGFRGLESLNPQNPRLLIRLFRDNFSRGFSCVR